MKALSKVTNSLKKIGKSTFKIYQILYTNVKSLIKALERRSENMQPKIRVERIYPNGYYKVKKYPIVDGLVIIKKGGRGRGDESYTPPMRADRIAKSKWLIFKREKVYYEDGAAELTPLLPSGDPPAYTTKYIKDLTKKKLLDRQAKVKDDKTVLYIILFMVVILVVLNLYQGGYLNFRF